MSTLTFCLIYVFIGFLVASVVIKFWPPYSLQDCYAIFPFIVAVWPLLVAFGIFYLPAILVGKWIKLLSGF